MQSLAFRVCPAFYPEQLSLFAVWQCADVAPLVFLAAADTHCHTSALPAVCDDCCAGPESLFGAAHRCHAHDSRATCWTLATAAAHALAAAKAHAAAKQLGEL